MQFLNFLLSQLNFNINGGEILTFKLFT